MRQGKNFIDNFLDYERVADRSGVPRSIGYEECGENWRPQNGAGGWATVTLVAALILIGAGLIVPKADSTWIGLLVIGGLLVPVAGFFWLLDRTMSSN